ncbi:MAG TPA: bacteriohopanetetrol glucosamine biosynthesis glycosyltransferase HpnI [Geobacteraceae bacterium]
MLRHLLPFLVILPSLAYGLIALVCARAFFRREKPATAYTPPVTILKPVKGMDAESFENFASFCRQDYPCFQIVFACASADDPVIPVIRKLMAAFPAADIDLVVDERIYGPNYKVCNLMNAFPRARHDLLIVCDSDISVGPRYLREVCAPFADPAVGLVTSLYRSPGVRGAATAVEAMGFTVEMVPNVMVALKLEGLSFALGASMAVRREALEKIGGFDALVDYLADDYQLGNKVCRAGYRLELSDYFVESVMHREGLATVLSRQLRWARTMRVSRPGGYLASGITQPFPALCLALICSGFSRAGLLAVLLLYGVRSLCGLVFSRRYIRDGLFPRYLWLLPARDLFAFATWGLSFLGNRVLWRGHRYRLVAGGRMMEIDSPGK